MQVVVLQLGIKPIKELQRQPILVVLRVEGLRLIHDVLLLFLVFITPLAFMLPFHLLVLAFAIVTFFLLLTHFIKPSD